MFRLILKCLLFLTVITASVNSYKILCAYPTISHSHFIALEPLLLALAEKGHNVTVASAYPPAALTKNYHHIKTENDKIYEEVLRKFIETPGNVFTTLKLVPMLIDFAASQARDMLNQAEFRKIMHNEKFDLVIIEGFHGNVLYGLGAHFECPLIVYTSARGSNNFLAQMGNPIGVAYNPNVMSEFKSPMSFAHRVGNFLFHLIEIPIMWDHWSRQEIHYNELFPSPKYPSFREMSRNVSAIFITQHFSEGDPMPLVPGIIEIGGMQLSDQPSVPLSTDLQKWMDDSEHGVIYFSFGSNVKCSSLPHEKYHAIINVFKRLKQNILWKCDTDQLESVPNNVKISKWLPQLSVLQHTQLKLFVTHGGLGSITEARYYGVPLVIIPFFGDQMTNAFKVKNENWAVILPYAELNEVSLYETMKLVADNTSYKSVAVYLSKLYRDRPLSALETAIFWVEYVIRHRGAPHMKSNAIYLNFWQLHSLDIIVFLIILATVTLYISYKLGKWMVKKILLRFRTTKLIKFFYKQKQK